MKKSSLNGPRFGFRLVLGLTCLCLGFLIATKFLRAVTLNVTSLDLPLVNDRWVSFYDQQRKEIGKVFVREKNPIRVSQMPTLLQRAFTQRKEAQFYSFNPKLSDVASVFVMELKAYLGIERPIHYQRGISSTLAYNLFMTRKKDLPHRLDEAILAYKIERKYRKEEILEFYLNNIYFGEGVFGVEAASNYYFGKHAAQLGADQIAFLLSLATDTLSSDIYWKEHLLQDPMLAREGRDEVLDELASIGLITPRQASEFKRKALRVVAY